MRTPITLKIKFKSSNLDQFIERYSVDVSRGGIFIRTKEPLPVGTQLRFEFQLQDASALIAGDGTVVWIREHDPARQGVAPGMGVRFDKLAVDSQKVLDRILSEKQKRGDAQLESRFDAGVRASASASGTVSTKDNKGHNDFSGGDSKAFTPLPGAMPGLETPGDEFGNESTRVMQNELVQSLADKTRGQTTHERDDLANPFADPEPTRKASVEELKLAVQGTAVEKAGELESKPEPKKEEAKVEVAAPAVVEAKKEEPKVIELKKEDKKEDKPAVAAVSSGKNGLAAVKHEEKKPEPKPEEKKPEEKKPAVAAAEVKTVKPAEKKEEKPAVAAPLPPRASEPPVRRRSNAPLYIGLGLVCAVGGYTVFRNKGGDESEQPKPQLVAAAPAAAPTEPAKPDETKVAQADTPKPTEGAQGATATGDKQPTVTPAEAPNPAAPAKEPTAALDKPTGLSVAVTSDPAGATVTLDGKPVEGQTPTTLGGLDAKKVYDVKLSMKGFHDWKVKLKPKAGDKVDAALVPNEKVVEVATTPPGADVMLDGKRVGKTPFTIRKIDLTKTHALEVKRAGFQPQKREISATDAFESKGDKDVLAVAMTLEVEPKAAAEKPAVATTVKKPAKKPAAAVKKPDAATEKPATAATEEKPAEGTAPAEKPAAAEKPATEKPAADKPAAAEKPATEKAAADKPAADKPAATEKPAGSEKGATDKAGIKVPNWTKQKPAEGGSTPPPPSDTPSQ